jgi:succinoglycan biosynthesis protein ExoA
VRDASDSTTVSVVIAALGWDEHLSRTIDCLLGQTTKSPFDVTVSLAQPVEPASLSERVRASVRFLENPMRSASAGLNRAIAASKGDIVVRVDSRCLIPAGYLDRVVSVLDDERVGCVGGAAVVLDPGALGGAYGVAFNGGLLGPSRYRTSTRPGPVDTVYLGAWRRETLERLGFFDESLGRNQDNELASRVRSAGLSVEYLPVLAVGYLTNRGFGDLVRHHYSFGLWRVEQRSSGGQAGIEPKHLLVGGLCGGLGIAWLVLVLKSPFRALLAVLTAYGLAGVIARSVSRRMRLLISDPVLTDPTVIASALAPALAGILDGAWILGAISASVRYHSGRSRSAPFKLVDDGNTK